MQLTAQLKLLATPAQADTLRRTLKQANDACDYISKRAWAAKSFRQFDLHKLCYRKVRERFGLAAQVTVRCISKVADAYKLDHRAKRTFRAHSAIAYDTRILRFEAAAVSIWGIGGRISIPFVCGDPQRRLLSTQKGEADLIYRRGSVLPQRDVRGQGSSPAGSQQVLGRRSGYRQHRFGLERQAV